MRVHHLAFRTDDVERLERFYADVIGLVVLRRQDTRSVWLDADGCIVMIERRNDVEPTVREDTRELVAFAVTPGSGGDLRERLGRWDVPVEASTEFTLYVRDPDGRRIGLSSYPARLE